MIVIAYTVEDFWASIMKLRNKIRNSETYALNSNIQNESGIKCDKNFKNPQNERAISNKLKILLKEIKSQKKSVKNHRFSTEKNDIQ